MIHVLGNGHLGQQAGIGLTALDDGRGHRLGHDLLAGLAGVLRVDIAPDVEVQRLAGQPLADVLADGHQGTVTLRAGAAGRLVTDLHPRQVLGQGLAPAGLAGLLDLPGRLAFGRQGLQLRFHGRDVGGHGLLEELALLGSMRSDRAENCSRRSRAISRLSCPIRASLRSMD